MTRLPRGGSCRPRFGFTQRHARPAHLLGLALVAAAFFALASGASGAGSVLIGSTTVQSTVDFNSAGRAEAFRASATASGNVTSVSVYIDSRSTASSLKVGLYTDSSGHPGALLAQGTISSPQVGAWNSASLNTSVAVSSGSNYWIAVLGPTGKFYFRDAHAHGGASETSSQSWLTSLPVAWATGTTYADGPISAYGVADITPATTDTTPPSAPANAAASGATQTSVSLSWSPSTDNVGVAGYGVYTNGASSGSTASTSYSVSGLACGTSYSFAVDAYDAAGNRSAKTSVSASTSACADTTAPSIPTGLAASAATQTSVSLAWSASSDNVGVTGYGVYTNGASSGSTASTSYSVSGLACGTSYTFAVDAYDAAGNRSGKASLTAATSACPDTQAPTTPANLTATSATASSVSLAWSPSLDNVGVSGYGVYKNGASAGSAASTSYTVSGLACGTSYSFAVDAYDAAGNRSGQASLTASTSACADTQAPSVPTNQRQSGATQTTIVFSWDASTDNVGVAGYSLYLNGTKVGTTTSTSYTYTGLACGTTYTVGLEAFDAAGNHSDIAYATGPMSTSACTDTTAPSVPTGLAASSVTQTSVSLAWSASTDNVGVAGYGVYKSGASAGSAASTSYAVSGLTCGTSYSFGVDAYDAAGNRSSQASLTASTSACSTPPPSGTANVWIDQNGGSCVRSATPISYAGTGDAQSCASMQAAQTAAAAGDRVIMSCGSYASQTISSGTKSSAVSYYAQTYDAVTSAPQVLAATSCVTISGLSLAGVDRIHIYGVQATPAPWNGAARDDSAELTYQRGGDLDVCASGCTGFTTQDILIDGWHGGTAFLRATNVTIDHSFFGGFDGCYTESQTHVSGPSPERDGFRFWDGTGGSGTPTNDVLSNSVVGNQPMGVDSSEASSVCGLGSSGGPHVDCMQNNGGQNITISGNIFFNCPSSDFQWAPFSGATMPGPIMIVNNYFGPASCCNRLGVLGLSGVNCSNFTFRNNTGYSALNSNGCSGSTAVQGNIFLGSNTSCGTAMTYANNVFGSGWGTTCGTNTRKCQPAFVSTPATAYAADTPVPDPRLLLTDTCANGWAYTIYPSTDIYGKPRPGNVSTVPEAGPYELNT
jgi:chitodextrinase